MFIVKLSNGCENAWERLQLSSISSFVLLRFEFIYSFFSPVLLIAAVKPAASLTKTTPQVVISFSFHNSIHESPKYYHVNPLKSLCS